MSINLGNTTISSLYLGSTKIGEAYLGATKIYSSAEIEPDYNPLNLPAYTARLKFSDGVSPSVSKGRLTRVSTSPNVWDYYYGNSNWDTKLYGKSGLIEILGANLNGVTSAYGLFRGCHDLTRAGAFDASTVTDLHQLFNSCDSLTVVEGIKTSSMTDMGSMFNYCTSLVTAPKLDTSNVTNMTGAFVECTNLISVPKYSTSNVTSMKEMFQDCSSLVSVPSFDTHNVTDMTRMFSGCTSLSSVPSFDTSNVTSASSMFVRCRSLLTAPVTSLPNATDINGMYQNCSSLTAVPQMNIPSGIIVSTLFHGTTSVASGALSLYNSIKNNYTGMSSSNVHYCFTDCGRNTVSGQAELAQIPAVWGGDLREWQDDFYIDIRCNSSKAIEVSTFMDDNYISFSSGYYYTNYSRNTASLSSSELDTLNTQAVLKKTCYGYKLYYTRSGKDPYRLAFYGSKNTSGVTSVSCTVTLYGKRVGDSAWSTVLTGSYTQASSKWWEYYTTL